MNSDYSKWNSIYYALTTPLIAFGNQITNLFFIVWWKWNESISQFFIKDRKINFCLKRTVSLIVNYKLLVNTLKPLELQFCDVYICKYSDLKYKQN